jgi:Ca2+-transporting ATPase
MDTMAAVALGLEPPDERLMSHQPRSRKAPLITTPMWYMILGMGLFTFAALMCLNQWNFLGEGHIGSREHLSVIFTTFVFIQVFNEINARSIDPGKNPFDRILESRYFLSIMALIVVVQIGLTQYGGELFQTHPLSLITWLKIIAFSSLALIVGAVIRAFMRMRGVTEV